MPPMDTETIGGISTGLSSYSGRVCVPTYSQNADDASNVCNGLATACIPRWSTAI